MVFNHNRWLTESVLPTRGGPYHIVHDNTGIFFYMIKKNHIVIFCLVDVITSHRYAADVRSHATCSATHAAQQHSTTSMAESNTAEQLIPKKGATLVVWNWFGYKRADKEQTTVICKQCKNTNIERGKYVKLISPPQAAAPGSVRGVSKSPRGELNSWR